MVGSIMLSEEIPAPNLKQPLAEVFGHLPTDMRSDAKGHRSTKHCRFTGVTCTKVEIEDPLGVCCVLDSGNAVITCPARFKENWTIAKDAADFFFPENSRWTFLSEVRLKDSEGESAGNIDMVLVRYDEEKQIIDFGALEVQAVYISGNVRNPFAFYMQNPSANSKMDWRREEKYPRPDFLSSSRKRLAPQLITKGGIIHSWGKKSAVVMDSHFFSRLPVMQEVSKDEGEIAWLIYDLILKDGRYQLTKTNVVYTRFKEALITITQKDSGDVSAFTEKLQNKLNLAFKFRGKPSNT